MKVARAHPRYIRAATDVPERLADVCPRMTEDSRYYHRLLWRERIHVECVQISVPLLRFQVREPFSRNLPWLVLPFGKRVFIQNFRDVNEVGAER